MCVCACLFCPSGTGLATAALCLQASGSTPCRPTHLQAFAAARLAGLCICRHLQQRALQAYASAGVCSCAPCRPMHLQAFAAARLAGSCQSLACVLACSWLRPCTLQAIGGLPGASGNLDGAVTTALILREPVAVSQGRLCVAPTQGVCSQSRPCDLETLSSL